jgi:Tfp pilus assembly protein PilO
MNLRGRIFALVLHAATGGLAAFSLVTNLIAGNYDNISWQANTIIFVCLSATHMLEVVGYENVIETANAKAVKMLEDAMEQKKQFDKKHSTKTQK